MRVPAFPGKTAALPRKTISEGARHESERLALLRREIEVEEVVVALLELVALVVREVAVELALQVAEIVEVAEELAGVAP